MESSGKKTCEVPEPSELSSPKQIQPPSQHRPGKWGFRIELYKPVGDVYPDGSFVDGLSD